MLKYCSTEMYAHNFIILIELLVLEVLQYFLLYYYFCTLIEAPLTA